MMNKNKFKSLVTLILLLLSNFAFAQVDQNCNLDISYNMDGISFNWSCEYNQSELMLTITIDSITGGSGVYAIEPFGEGIVSNTLATEGTGFKYFFTENDQDNGNIGFLIYDGLYDSCYLDPILETALAFPNFDWCNADLPACNEKIEVTYLLDSLNSNVQCNDSSSTISIEVINVIGGDNSFAINTLGLGDLTFPDANNLNNFIYTFDQFDIDSQLSEVGFAIDDENGCLRNYDFSGAFAFTEIMEYCEYMDTTMIDTMMVDTTIIDTMMVDTTIIDTTMIDTTTIDTTNTFIFGHSNYNRTLKVYPTSFIEKLTVEIEFFSNLESIVIFDITGKAIYHKSNINNNTIQINTTSFISGTYFVTAQTMDGVYHNNKVIKF